MAVSQAQLQSATPAAPTQVRGAKAACSLAPTGLRLRSPVHPAAGPDWSACFEKGISRSAPLPCLRLLLQKRVRGPASLHSSWIAASLHAAARRHRHWDRWKQKQLTSRGWPTAISRPVNRPRYLERDHACSSATGRTKHEFQGLNDVSVRDETPPRKVSQPC